MKIGTNLLVLAAVAPIGIAATTAGDDAAADPVAIVEEIEASGSDLGFMDYVEPGDMIDLQTDERLVLGYFASCIEETIIGGIVRVGTSESEVSGGSVRRRKLACDSGPLELSDNQINDSAVVAFRKGDSEGVPNVKPEQTLYGLSPLVRSSTAGRLIIIRLDREAARLEVPIGRGVTDFAKRDIALMPGGIYQAVLKSGDGERSLVFETDAYAQAGEQPNLSRLIRF